MIASVVGRSAPWFLVAALILVVIMPMECAFGADGASSVRPGGGPAGNTGYVFAAFLFVWGALWLYLVAIHRGQRRMEERLSRLEKSRGGDPS